MLLQAINEQKTLKERSGDMATAWHEGDAARFASRMSESMQDLPDLKKLMLDDRNAAWVPKIEAYLDGTETAMILVGSGHLSGSGSLIDLLEKKGVKFTQMEYRTMRPPMPAAGNKE
jgi:uncharacterized protein YbaP (TraB family)